MLGRLCVVNVHGVPSLTYLAVAKQLSKDVYKQPFINSLLLVHFVSQCGLSLVLDFKALTPGRPRLPLFSLSQHFSAIFHPTLPL